MKDKNKSLITAIFLATLPDIQSAIKIGSDTMRIQLEVPETEKPKAIPVIALTHKVLEITIRELSQEETQSKTWTQLDDETKKSAKGSTATVDRGRAKYHGDKREG